MKINHFLLGALAVAAILSGCKKEEEPVEAGMTLTPETLTFGANDAVAQTVTVVSSKDWKAADCPDWVSLAIDGKNIKGVSVEAGTKTVSVSVLSNSGADRTASVVFNGGTVAKKTLTIKQGSDIKYTSIADIKALLGTKESVTLDSNIFIKAVIISNIALSNQTSTKNTIIQDETAGICMRLASDCTWNFGDEIAVNVSGQVLQKYMGAYQLNGVPNANVTFIQNTTPTPIAISIKDLLDNKYESRYVSVDSVQVADSDTTKSWAKSSANTSINMKSVSGEGFVVFSSKYSTFNSKVAQGSGTLKGVGSINNSTIQMMFAQSTDADDLVHERFGQVVSVKTIAEVLASSKGADVQVAARVIDIIPSGLILNDGTQDCLYAYIKDTTKLKFTGAVGDIVAVTGSIEVYGSVYELVATAIEASTATIAPTPELTAQKLTSSDISSYSGKGANRVSVTGKFIVDGSFLNIEFDGITKKGSVKIASSLTSHFQSFSGKRVNVEGYYGGYTSNYFFVFCTKTTDISEVTEAYLTVSPKESNVAAADTTATFTINTNQSWTAESLTAGFTVGTASGTGDGSTTITFAANTDTTAKVGLIRISAAGLADTVKVIQAKYVESGSKEFKLVTAAPADWSGEYLIGYIKPDTDTVYVFNGKDVANGYVLAIKSGNVIEYSEALAAVTVKVASMEGGYSLKVTAGYMYGTSGSNVLNFNTTTAQANTIAYDTDNVKITSNTSVLSFNSTSNQMRFRYYKAASYAQQKRTQLFKLVDKTK